MFISNNWLAIANNKFSYSGRCILVTSSWPAWTTNIATKGLWLGMWGMSAPAYESHGFIFLDSNPKYASCEKSGSFLYKLEFSWYIINIGLMIEIKILYQTVEMRGKCCRKNDQSYLGWHDWCLSDMTQTTWQNHYRDAQKRHRLSLINNWLSNQTLIDLNAVIGNWPISTLDSHWLYKWLNHR